MAKMQKSDFMFGKFDINFISVSGNQYQKGILKGTRPERERERERENE
jgi:hypothetical protein